MNGTRTPFWRRLADKIRAFFNRIRRRALQRGYACDCCGAELFDYPSRRLCESCEEKLLVPRKPCPKCGRERIAEGLCLTCKVLPPKFTQGISAFVYKGEAGILVNRMKNGAPRLAEYLGEKMTERFLERRLPIETPLLLVAVPMTKKREIERGYNQAERLAERVAESLRENDVAVEVQFSLLVKRRENGQQKHATQRERAENVRGAYLLRRRKPFEGRTVLLIDDIMTTGSTGNECARKMLSAGAKAVYFLTATAVPEMK